MIKLNLPAKYNNQLTWFSWLLVLIYLNFSATRAAPGDFANYYFGAKAFLQGAFTTDILYEVGAFNRWIIEQYGSVIYSNYTPVPPPTVWVYLPFAGLSLLHAKIAWNLLGSLMLLFSVMPLSKENKYAPVLPWALFVPLQSNFYQGQTYLFIAVMLLEGYKLLEKRQPFLAMLCINIAAILKLTPFIVYFYLLVSKQYKALIIGISSLLILMLLNVFLLPLPVMKYYYLEVLPRLALGEINNTYATAYQSLQVLLKQVFVSDGLHNPNALVHLPIAYKMLWALFVCIVLWLAGAGYSHKGSFAMVVLSSFLVSGYGSTYSLCLLIVPLLLFYDALSYHQYKLFVLLIGITCTLPFSIIQQLPFPLNFWRFYFLLGAFLLAVWVMKKEWLRLWPGVLCLLPLFTALRFEPKEESSYVLTEEVALLCDDFYLKGDSLCLTCFGANGVENKHVLLPHEERLYEPLLTRKNQIVFNNKAQITLTRQNIKKALLVNDEIWYLTDKGRGVGFYALRRMSLPNNP